VTEAPVRRESQVARATHPAIQQFYARQMQLLDDGAISEWARTFTEDATFASNAMPTPLAGRPAILDGATAHDKLRASGTQRRHLLSNLSLETGSDGMLTAVSYVMVVETADGSTTVLFNTLLEDELTHENGEWRVRARRIKRDDLG